MLVQPPIVGALTNILGEGQGDSGHMQEDNITDFAFIILEISKLYDIAL